MLPLLAKVSRDTPAAHQKTLITRILVSLLESLRDVKIPFGHQGIQQFILDVTFIISISEPFYTDGLGELAGVVCGEAIKSYKSIHQSNAKDLKDRSWFSQVAASLLDRHPVDFGLAASQ